ncbi:uncharacterized protein LDX57_003172 [Aspergillus melleus]|uniref:uncharacterized protein n=1 Tax=Aspergillus melleus TaxID=138277 RepID=UPI001E8D5E79|nr:uncharacterized protein LDX57_003172 [Aspergillus melleus]KAH8425419.1 hypothetical protein LDX57_003172 [Aspergillus melleus]
MPSLQNNIGFLNTLQSVKPHSPEGAVQYVWQAIVTEWSPGRDGYKWVFKPATPGESNLPNVTVYQIKPLQNAKEWDERQILRVECKPPSSEEWHSTIATELNGKRLFGAVAVGKKVRFYQFGRGPSGQAVVQLHQDTLDMDDSDDIVQIETWMDYIKMNAWQWSGC